MYLSRKYLATVHSTVCPLSNCRGNLKQNHSSPTTTTSRSSQCLRLHLRGPPRDVANPVFPTHRAAVGDFDFQALDLFGELHPLAVSQRLPLLINVPNVQHFAHEFDYGLRFVECRRRYWKQSSEMWFWRFWEGFTVYVQHHFPLTGPHRLVETKPHLPTATYKNSFIEGNEKKTAETNMSQKNTSKKLTVTGTAEEYPKINTVKSRPCQNPRNSWN